MSSDVLRNDVTTSALKVDIWSDIACPWCYVGKRKFEIGAANFAADGRTVDVEYHSYELSPESPVGVAVPEIEFLSQRLGVSREETIAKLGQMEGVGQSVGIEFDYEALQHTNTGRGHQLIHYAKAHGKQAVAKERLFRAYFVEGRNLGSVAELAELAEEIGLDRADVARSLGADEFQDEVRADEQQAREYGITGVPFFVIEGKYGVSGALDPTVFAQALEQAWAQRDR
jgi:predicted DsbA family dithiol-disulfide isomerase